MEQIPRPTTYKCLAFRQHAVPADVPDGRPIDWQNPPRARVFTLMPSEALVAESDDDDEGPVLMDDVD